MYVKLQPAVLASHMHVSSSLDCSTYNPDPCHVPEKTEEDNPSPWAPVSTLETKKLLASSLRPAQL